MDNMYFETDVKCLPNRMQKENKDLNALKYKTEKQMYNLKRKGVTDILLSIHILTGTNNFAW